MAKVRTKSVKNLKRRQWKAQCKASRKQRKQRQRRQMQPVNIGRAARNLQASPRAHGLSAVRAYWEEVEVEERRET